VPVTSIAVRVPGHRRARVVLAAGVVCAGLALGGGAASAAQARAVTICSSRATLYETPGGAKVGVLHEGDHVRVLARDRDDVWWRVVAGFGTRGWLRSSAICGHRR
jgi:hypothetical protein